jgi:hypothetical protein
LVGCDELAVSKRARKDVVDYPQRAALVGAQWGAGVGIGVVASGVVVSGVLMPVDWWGALAAWSGSVGALAAVAVAVFTTRVQADEAARRARDDQAEREVQQARLVTVEFTPSGLDDPQYSDEYDFHIKITNHSAELILDPRLDGFTHPQNAGQVNWDVVDLPEYGEYPGPPSVLPPGGTEGLLVTTTYRPELKPDTTVKTQAVISFTDAAGRRWRRVGSSLPVRVHATSSSAASENSVAHSFRANGPDWYRIT